MSYSSYLPSRTEQKLKYAQVHIQELQNYASATSNDTWENAHQESVFYHLAGVIDCIYQDINRGHDLGLEIDEVNRNNVRRKLTESEVVSEAFNFIEELRNCEESWLNVLLEWRNHGAHRARVSKIVLSEGENKFRDPRTNEYPEVFERENLGCMGVIKRLEKEIISLIDNCRTVDEMIKP